jgi:hypothetical protein
MNKEISQQLYEKHPGLLQRGNTERMARHNEGKPYFPFEHGDGWYGIVSEMLMDIEMVDPEAVLLQAKEKFGLLRVYITGNEDAHDIVDHCERLSATVCEACGSTEDVTTKGGWLQTLCKECRGA